MKSLVFDTGPIITLTLNDLMWVLEPLKKQFNGKFYIPQDVRRELIDHPLEINKFKFEALHTLRYIRKKTIEIYPEKKYEALADELFLLSNSLFSAHHKDIQIMHKGEIETIALACLIGASAIVIDERTTREMLTDPQKVKRRLSKKLHTTVHIDRKKLAHFQKLTKDVAVIRSVELMVIAYEMGLLDRYLPEKPYHRAILLDAVLWALKLNGCSISEEEIEAIMHLENTKTI